jgi:uncharacterized membrane protein
MHGFGTYQAASGAIAPAVRVVARDRIEAVDLLRGLVIILMVLDHVRDYFHAEAFLFSAVDPDKSYPALFATRWITHLCAPVFVALAGVSAYLQLQAGKPVADVRRLLWTRGLWLIALELTVVSFGWNFGTPVPFLQVIWAIGCSMIALAAAVSFRPAVVAAIGAIIVLGHNFLDPVTPAALGPLGLGWQFLHEGGPLVIAGQPLGFIAYPVLPWIGVMFLGFGLGRAFMLERSQRQLLLAGAGAIMLVAFVVLRATNLFGDPEPWMAREETVRSVMAFLNVEKYPPSFLYVLATLGVALLLTPLLERLPQLGREVLLTYGRVPLLAYVSHIYIVHGLMLLTAIATWGDPSVAIDFVTNAFTNPEAVEGWGFGLSFTFAVWALTLVMLFPLCRWFGELKKRRRDWWLSYL